MARNWEKTISVSDIWDTPMSPRTMVPLIIERFRETFEQDAEPELDNLLDEFAFALEDEHFSVDDFDAIWEEIYDWADENSIWIDC